LQAFIAPRSNSVIIATVLPYPRFEHSEMKLQPHSITAWMLLFLPYALWLVLWLAGRRSRVSLKALIPWFGAFYLFSLAGYFVLGAAGRKPFLLGSVMWAAYGTTIWLKNRTRFETLANTDSLWSFPWSSVTFSMSAPIIRIQAHNLKTLVPWYTQKLGLHKLTDTAADGNTAELKFTGDGKSIVLTTQCGVVPDHTPIFFTKKLLKMRDILTARGVSPGSIEKDRQGTNFFQIHDPEGNVLEVVEET
jgi:hypothetical protein